jgi:trans-aconitate methyltransferase
MKFFVSRLYVVLLLVVQTTFAQQLPVWDGNHYHKHARPQYEAGIKHLDNLPLAKWKRIVDIGCASGGITDEIARRAPEAMVVGIDICPEMIATAKSLHAKQNLYFRVLDAQELDYDSTFDGAVSFLTLHWMNDKQTFFHRLFSSLRAQGEFCLTVDANNAEMETLRKKFFKSLLRDKKWEFLEKTEIEMANNAVSHDELYEAATKAGFIDLEIKEEISWHDFKSKQELADFFATFSGVDKDIAALPEESRKEFVTTATNTWIALFPEGKITYMWANLVAKGRKPTCCTVAD